jgi:putative tryptophan/tyrosine transport system substrate-binding protein
MRRRDFIRAMLLSSSFVELAFAQQQGKTYRVAFVATSVSPSSIRENSSSPIYRELFRELSRLGYRENLNLLVERFSGGGRTEIYAEMCRQAVAGNPDAVYAISVRLVAHLKAATKTIPIIAIMADPVAFGVVASLGRPGGNITGVTVDAGIELWGKRMELLREILPGISRLGFLAPEVSWGDAFGKAVHQAAQRAKLTLLGPPLGTPINEFEYERVLSAMAEARPDALLVSDVPENFNNRESIIRLVSRHRIPTIYPTREYVESGGLLSYGIDLGELGRISANQIHQVLKGAKPAEMPIQQPTRYELLVNNGTAKALDLQLSESFLLRADAVIE